MASAFSRRNFLQTVSAAALAGGTHWTSPLARAADDLRRRGMSCILLWMPGGPSQFETFDPKPDHANGGETKAIDTNVSGIRFAENLPELAKVADKLAVFRSLSTKEGDHARGTHLMHTASLPLGGIQYPSLGAVAAHELGDEACELPAFVKVGGGGNGAPGGGFLGAKYDAFPVTAAQRPPENVRLSIDAERFTGRLDLMNRLHTASHRGRGATSDHQALYAGAAKMILSPQMQAFDISGEPADVCAAYGYDPASLPGAGGAARGATTPQSIEFRRGMFASSCILARRLVEAGVTFVELAVPGWDTHVDNFNQCKALCGALDRPYAQLLRDLDERGLLKSTLVIWMGEFGRTPRINPNSGRDHYPRAFSAVLSGAGVRGGQVIGQTEPSGDAVKDRPVSEKDFFQTIYKALGVNTTKQQMTPIGRPIRYVEGGEAIDEAFA